MTHDVEANDPDGTATEHRQPTAVPYVPDGPYETERDGIPLRLQSSNDTDALERLRDRLRQL